MRAWVADRLAITRHFSWVIRTQGSAVPELVCFGDELMRGFQVEKDACLTRFYMPHRVVAVIDPDQFHTG